MHVDPVTDPYAVLLRIDIAGDQLNGLNDDLIDGPDDRRFILGLLRLPFLLLRKLQIAHDLIDRRP
jgi:hypothetical protein